MKKLAYYSITATLVFMLIGLCFLSTPANAGHYKHKFPYNPVIFVHGGSGSGGQFESQAMRFTSNGYPQDHINVHEYDSSFSINTMEDVWNRLDQLIADLQKEFGVDQVDILGHSLGTTVMHGYLAFPNRAANVAHYVNIDGRTATALPGGVPTLAIWAGRGTPGRMIVGATNVTVPNQTHVQSATSAESFFEMYKFFTGHEPKTTEVLPEPFGSIWIAGRAVLFPQNVGVANSTLEIYKVNGDTGFRIHNKPEAIYAIDESGNWGPFKAKAGEYYEFNIVRPGQNHHFYYEPFIRDDYLVRLLASPIGGGTGALLDTSEKQSNLGIIRYKEVWGDQGIQNDILAVNGVNLANEAICPITKRVNSLYAFDKGSDGISDLSQMIPVFVPISFLTGVDFYIPGANPPHESIRITLIPRGGNGKMQILNVPNWVSTIEGPRITIQFRDFLQKENLPCGDGAKHWW
jgi:hypothetical protein